MTKLKVKTKKVSRRKTTDKTHNHFRSERKINLKKSDKYDVFRFLLKWMAWTPENVNAYRYIYLEDGNLYVSDAVLGRVFLDKHVVGEIYSINILLNELKIPFYYTDGYFYTKQSIEDCDWFEGHLHLTKKDKELKRLGYKHKHTLKEGIEELLEYNSVIKELERLCKECNLE
jgi:hypothetical protein